MLEREYLEAMTTMAKVISDLRKDLATQRSVSDMYRREADKAKRCTCPKEEYYEGGNDGNGAA